MIRKPAAVLSASLLVASCAQATYTAGPVDQAEARPAVDSNWVWAGLALALLFAISRD